MKNPLHDKIGYNERIFLSEHYNSMLKTYFFDYSEMGIQSDEFYHLERYEKPNESRFNIGFRLCRTTKSEK